MQHHLVYLKERRGKIALACGSASIIFTPQMLGRLGDSINSLLGRRLEPPLFWLCQVCESRLLLASQECPACEAELLRLGWPGRPPGDDGPEPW